jgi:CubicO group peptidase (beta-lactamase class C family)
LKRIVVRSLFILSLAILGYVFYYGWRSFPIIAGFGAKDLCSCMFVGGRTEADVKQEELGDFPFTLGKYEVNLKDSSVTGRVWGMARRKAIYRQGLGCTLVNDIDESSLRKQSIDAERMFKGNPDSIPWPDGDLLRDSFPVDMDQNALNRAVDAAFASPDSTKKPRTRAVVVVYNGQLVAEKYAAGFGAHSPMHGWSVAKSFAGALIGILVKEGKLKLSDPALVPAWRPGDPRHEITLQHLIQQTSGLDFKEDYTGYSEVTNMLFNKGDMPAFTERLPLKYKPGTVFNYTSGNSNILSAILRRTLGDKDYYSFPWTSLFQKIGMRSAVLEPDASGNFVLSSYIFATARDYARFGLLYYNNGKWKGEQVLPVNWVKETRNPPPSNEQRNYGYQFWIRGLDHHYPHLPNFPDVPADLYYADGFAVQEIYIIPSKKLVVVRLGLTLDKSFDENKFLKEIVGAVR